MSDLLRSFSTFDVVAVVLLALAWAGTSLLIEHPPSRRASVTLLMQRYRRDWMTEMLARENRIFDSNILASLRQGTTFMTSASMIAVGGVVALAGNVEPLDSIGTAVGIGGYPAAFWQAKLGLVALLLTHAVFKFIWSNRLFGYCSVMMASVPNDVTDPRTAVRGAQVAEINIRAALNFNRGLRSVYFAFAALAWVLGPWALLLSVAATVWSVLSREFASTSRGVLLDQ